jgi:hypothetical protein
VRSVRECWFVGVVYYSVASWATAESDGMSLEQRTDRSEKMMVLEAHEAYGKFTSVRSLKDEVRVRNGVMRIAFDERYDTACKQSVLVRLVKHLEKLVIHWRY